MTPAKRRPANPESRGPKRAEPAPEVPIVADPPPTRAAPAPEVAIVADVPPVPPPPAPEVAIVADVPTAPPEAPVPDELVIAPVPPAETKDSTHEAPTEDASGDLAAPTDTGQVDPEDRATTQSPRRSRALFPGRVWPD